MTRSKTFFWPRRRAWAPSDSIASRPNALRAGPSSRPRSARRRQLRLALLSGTMSALLSPATQRFARAGSAVRPLFRPLIHEPARRSIRSERWYAAQPHPRGASACWRGVCSIPVYWTFIGHSGALRPDALCRWQLRCARDQALGFVSCRVPTPCARFLLRADVTAKIPAPSVAYTGCANRPGAEIMSRMTKKNFRHSSNSGRRANTVFRLPYRR
jgi:hypothetical protein